LVKVGYVVVDVEDLMVFWKLISASDLDVDLKGAHDDIVGLADDGVIEEVRLFWCAILRKELAPDNEENNPQGEEDVITDHPERKDQEPEPNVKELEEICEGSRSGKGEDQQDGVENHIELSINKKTEFCDSFLLSDS
jgi:hypothetical protein